MFLSQYTHLGINWEQPWLIYIILSGIELWIFPFLALLEGCGQISNVYLFRLYRTVIRYLVLWLILFLGGELWIAAGEVGVSTCIFLIAISLKYRNFFSPFFLYSFKKKFHGRKKFGPCNGDWQSAHREGIWFIPFTPRLCFTTTMPPPPGKWE